MIYKDGEKHISVKELTQYLRGKGIDTYMRSCAKPETKAKSKYNKNNYSTVQVYLDKKLVKRFKDTCKSAGVSQASVIKTMIEKWLSEE